jgi:Uma2 family endonuclease
MSLVLAPETIAALEDEAAFRALCVAHPEWRFERDRWGRLVIMPPVGWDGARREVGPLVALATWNAERRLGTVLSSQALFRLPGAGWRSPDAAWVSAPRAARLTPEERRGFPPIAPDFVIEVRSPSDESGELHAKMAEYVGAGVRLGWLLDPDAGTATIYRADRTVVTVPLALPLSGEDVLPGFVYVWQDEAP